MNVSQALDDIKTFLEGDPLVQAAVNLPVAATTRSVLADVVNALASEFYRATQESADAARADAAANAAAPEAYPQ